VENTVATILITLKSLISYFVVKRFFLNIALLLLTFSGWAQKEVPETIVEFKFSNDFVFGTDHYFSNGLKLSVYNNLVAKSPVNYLLPGFRNGNNYYAFTIIHNIYTPSNIKTTEIQSGDVPYAAYLLFGNMRESFSLRKKIKITSQLQLGVIGPAAGGRQIQNGIHSLLPPSFPAEGWNNQVSNDFAFQYSLGIEKGLLNTKYFELIADANSVLGNPHTEIATGLHFRLGLMDSYFKGKGLDDNSLQVYLFGRGQINYVAYNAVLQGGLFGGTDPYNIETINHFLGYSQLGMAVEYKRFRLEFAQEMLTPQFSNGSKHQWGYLNIIIGF